MLLLANNVGDKTSQKVRTEKNSESVCALYVIYTRVITLHSCYMRMHSFSANQKPVIFLCTSLSIVIDY